MSGASDARAPITQGRASDHAVLDGDHLARMTLGDRGLEGEVLALFDRQAELLLERIRTDEGEAAMAAHTLKGSARGIGAFAVAHAAEAVEQAAVGARPGPNARLAAAVSEVRAEIARILVARHSSAA